MWVYSTCAGHVRYTRSRQVKLARERERKRKRERKGKERKGKERKGKVGARFEAHSDSDGRSSRVWKIR